jgi:cytoplasmic iron level regulating protein YaaA (DUF328/UPF0246 family)
VTQRLLVLIPPSQAKAAGGRRALRRGDFDEVLSEPRSQVRAALRDFVARASTRELETTLGARGPLLERAVQATGEVLSGEAVLAPAWRRYQGVVWGHLDPASLSSALRRRILVPSGLYGLLTSEDPIADYRLKMNVRLKPLPSLASFWRPLLTSILEEGTKNTTLVNLLPQEHAASIDFHSLAERHRVIHVHFVAGDEKRAVGHDAKAVKGIVARHILTRGLESIEELRWQGWSVLRQESNVYVSAPK